MRRASGAGDGVQQRRRRRSTVTSPSQPGAAGGRAHASARRQPDDERERAGGRRQRVRGDEVHGPHGVRERRRQPGEEEPVDRQAEQHDGVEHRVRQVRRDHHGHHRDDPDPREVRPGEHLPAGPPVEQHPGERARAPRRAAARRRAPRRSPRGTAARIENSAYDASATWKTPSLSWLDSRTANSRRNHRPRSRCARWRHVDAGGVGGPGVADERAARSSGRHRSTGRAGAPHPDEPGAGHRVLRATVRSGGDRVPVEAPERVRLGDDRRPGSRPAGRRGTGRRRRSARRRSRGRTGSATRRCP